MRLFVIFPDLSIALFPKSSECVAGDFISFSQPALIDFAPLGSIETFLVILNHSILPRSMLKCEHVPLGLEVWLERALNKSKYEFRIY